ncbi:response regulator [Pontiella sulfatireligans]|uniref:Transcriptional regulatory protein LiaR n=1 Tax=Pontiella sulfatireligans TaxID=2750658 RepID=A0A6C2UXB4_9BACT|nr:response regulator transcription factor [Pontiella sulfatireligans]VGO23496.1 Transcriptional regulatory protein LiaR [Pontiella sulfatireligans]
MGKNTRILIVDDNAMLRFGLIGAIGHEEGLEVVGEAASGSEAFDLYKKLKPDVVTMDYKMPGMNGVECTRQILAEFPDARIILFSVFETEEDIWKSVKAGVKGYLTKNAGAVEDVMEAIYEVAGGGTYFPALIAEKIEARKLQEELTPRELEVLQLLGEGKSNKDIIEHFDISLSTVKHHITNIREKLGATDRTQAVVIAYKKGILHVD